MRFLTCLPRFSEKPQLKLLPNSVVIFMQNQVSPVCQSIFGLSLSLGGIIGSLCTPALANLAAPKSEDLSAASRHPNSRISSRTSSRMMATNPPSAASADSEPSNIDYFDRGYKGNQIAVEDYQQPKFVSSCALAECDVGVAKLISDPAMAHIERADIGITEKSQTLGLGVLPSASARNDLQNGFVSDILRLPEIDSDLPSRAQIPDLRDSIPRERIIRDRTLVEGPPDEDLGELRLQLQRSRQNEDLGILRLLKTAEAAPPPPRQPVAFVSGRLGFLDSDNVFRSNDLRKPDDGTPSLRRRIDEQVYQAGLTLFLFPKLSDDTNFYAIAGTSLAAYGRKPASNNNQLDLQLGVRQRLFSRTYAQLGVRNQSFYRSGYSKKILGINSIEGQLSHRSILNNRTWIDSFYQARVSFADTKGNPDRVSKFRQTFTVSLNYGASRDLRTSLLYQVDFDDFDKTSRYDTYHQVLASLSYKLTPEARLSLFGGTRFGRSSDPNVNLDDTFYGAGLNVTLPLF